MKVKKTPVLTNPKMETNFGSVDTQNESSSESQNLGNKPKYTKVISWKQKYPCLNHKKAKGQY